MPKSTAALMDQESNTILSAVAAIVGAATIAGSSREQEIQGSKLPQPRKQLQHSEGGSWGLQTGTTQRQRSRGAHRLGSNVRARELWMEPRRILSAFTMTADRSFPATFAKTKGGRRSGFRA